MDSARLTLDIVMTKDPENDSKMRLDTVRSELLDLQSRQKQFTAVDSKNATPCVVHIVDTRRIAVCHSTVLAVATPIVSAQALLLFFLSEAQFAPNRRAIMLYYYDKTLALLNCAAKMIKAYSAGKDLGVVRKFVDSTPLLPTRVIGTGKGVAQEIIFAKQDKDMKNETDAQKTLLAGLPANYHIEPGKKRPKPFNYASPIFHRSGETDH
jgi:hypothetical protein